MRGRSGLEQAIQRLRLAGCPWRVRENPNGRSPYPVVYETRRGGRSMAAKRFPLDDDNALEELASLLLKAQKEMLAGGPGLDWTVLVETGGTLAQGGQTWGEIRQLVLADIAPGGAKARDRNPFVCFRDAGHFGRSFEDAQVASVEDLETFALFTPGSIEANRADATAPLVKRAYNAKGFLQVIQMVNYLARKGVTIATPELRAKLQGLKVSSGKLQAPKTRFIPRTTDIEEWLDQLQGLDPFRGWVMAMVATYGLRNHELWHLDSLPGEDRDDPRLISVGHFSADGSGTQTKTGHRFAIALPEAWIGRYRLNDRNHGRAMLAELRRRYPIKTVECSDGTVQFINNEQLGRVLTHWMRNSARPDRELPVHLYGYHQPRQLPGKPKPKEKRERCKVYDLRHAWALRARETTTWSTSLKAQAMGHSEAVHARRYLVEERAEHRRQGLLQLVAQDEGRTTTSTSAGNGSASASATAVASVSATEAISPEILALARQLVALKVQA